MARILLVSHDRRATALMSTALGSEGFGVDAVPRCDSSMRLATNGRYELVLLDFAEPAVAGVSFVRDVLSARPEQLLFVVLGLNDQRSRLACLELGACDVLSKPYDLTELVVRVRNIVSRMAFLRAGRELRAGRLTLDIRRRTIDTGDGEEKRLSTREFVLLQHLMAREGDVCTRAEILADVWGYSFDPGTNVVDVYIARLRTKLGSGLIDTVRNVGYVLNAPG